MTSRPPRSRPISEAGGFDVSRSHVRVVLRDVHVQANVGLHAWERHAERPSRLIVNVEMYAYSGGPADGGGRAGIIDYDPVRRAISTWPGRPHVDLLETLVEELVGACFDNAAVEACRVSVVKPDIFNDAAAAGVEVFRVRVP